MDNITHTLVGLSASELFFQNQKIEKKADARFHYSTWLIAFIANNFPDLDYLAVLFLPFKRLNWLLHHRGHTHTLFLAPFEALFILGGFWVLCRMLRWKWEKKDWQFFFLIGVTGIFLHVLLDSLNSYGVHPFWPFHNEWYYLDLIFIVEPFLWVMFSSLLFFSRSNHFARLGFLTASVAAVALSWFSGYVLWQMALATTVFGALSFFVGVKTSWKIHTAHVWGNVLVFLLFFFFVSESVRIKTTRTLLKDSPGVIVHDIVRTPLPTNPFCWNVVSVESLGPIASYRMQRGLVTPFPNWISQEDCMGLPVARAFRNAEKLVRESPEIMWIGSREGNIEMLRELNKEHCAMSAFLQFSRAPIFKMDAEKLTMWDMRFELRGKNFTEESEPIEWKKGPECPFLAPWVPPRQDLLQN